MRRGHSAAEVADALEAAAAELREAVGAGCGASRRLHLVDWLPLVREALARRLACRTQVLRQRAMLTQMRRRRGTEAA